MGKSRIPAEYDKDSTPQGAKSYAKRTLAFDNTKEVIDIYKNRKDV
jgi:hypothetical protein